MAFAVLVASSLSLAPGRALADEPDPYRLRHFAVNANPAALGIGRLSGDATIVPVTHHALVLTPFATYVTPDTLVKPSDRTQTGYGGELAYHFYSGVRGPSGLFVGGGALLSRTHVAAGVGLGAEDLTTVGFIFDFGLQRVFDSGFMVGGGFGAQVAKDVGTSKLWHLDPRFLLLIGYAF